MIRIGVDAMGGDHAPQVVVRGAVEAAAELGPERRVVLFGDRDAIVRLLREEGAEESALEIVHTTEVIGFDDNPAVAFVKKADSSITVGFNHLKDGRIDGFASAGNTGAMMAGSMLAIKPVEGVIRPVISTVIPTTDGGRTLLLDVGLNVDCKPEVLYQYGIIGNLFARHVMKVAEPRVGLLNIGEESEKGNHAAKTVYELMASSDEFRFAGNVEAQSLFTGDVADVIVCDGFVGNVVLKQTEGFYHILKGRAVADTFVDSLNYELYGGTPVLGVNATVVIGHGRSSAQAIKNMILQTERMVQSSINTRIAEAFAGCNK
ncbi:MAG: phosphate acyltransferase PlsX [Rikenellaceae bacterium]|jgi:glycerol-3-phosphate acyltransferase PlsX|nr:phosphate acyltransferase PlsX [Rikenellaceae bacterium]